MRQRPDDRRFRAESMLSGARRNAPNPHTAPSALASRDELVPRTREAMLGHQFRTPLQSAMLNVDMLLESGVSERERHAMLLDLRAALAHMAIQLDRVLKLASANGRSSRGVALPLSAAFEAAVAVRHEDIAAGQVQVMCNPGDHCLDVDAELLALLLDNLIGNALKYRDPRKRSRRLWLAAEADGDRTLLRIRDNGLGIEADDLAHVFDLHFRAAWRDPDRMQPGGAGVGLYLVRQAVHALGGSIEVDSTIGEWTEFKVSVPTHAPD